MKDFDSSLLQAIHGQTTYLESSWFGTYRHWKRNNLLQKYSFANMSSMICGVTSDPQYRELPDIIQRLRQMIPIFDSFVFSLTLSESALTWQIHDVVSLTQHATPAIIHQPPLENPDYVHLSSILTPYSTCVDDTVSTNDFDDGVNVVIKELNGVECNLTMFPSLSVHSMKERYFHLVGLEVAQQRMLFNGKVMSDEDNLHSLGVVDRSIVHLVRRLRGGARTKTTSIRPTYSARTNF